MKIEFLSEDWLDYSETRRVLTMMKDGNIRIEKFSGVRSSGLENFSTASMTPHEALRDLAKAGHLSVPRFSSTEILCSPELAATLEPLLEIDMQGFTFDAYSDRPVNLGWTRSDYFDVIKDFGGWPELGNVNLNGTQLFPVSLHGAENDRMILTSEMDENSLAGWIFEVHLVKRVSLDSFEFLLEDYISSTKFGYVCTRHIDSERRYFKLEGSSFEEAIVHYMVAQRYYFRDLASVSTFTELLRKAHQNKSSGHNPVPDVGSSRFGITCPGNELAKLDLQWIMEQVGHYEAKSESGSKYRKLFGDSLINRREPLFWQ